MYQLLDKLRTQYYQAEQEQQETTMTTTITIPPVEAIDQPSPSSPEEVSTIEMELHKLINAERKKIGVPVLQIDKDLEAIAEKHSIDMQVRNFFSHTNPSGDNSMERAQKAGYKYRSYAENIAWYSNTSLSKMSKQEIANKIMYGKGGWWLSKEGHKEALLSSKYDRHGLGVWVYGNKVWATDNFARK